MNSKKAQVTLFVIIAIVVAASVLIVYSTGMFEKLKESAMPDSVKAAKSDIDSCVAKASKESLGIISAQGGFLAPEDYYFEGNIHLAYWYDDKDLSPATEDIEKEMSDTACLSLLTCIDFERYSLIAGECSAKTTIKSDSVLIDINYPITMTSADKEYKFQSFSAKLNARLGKVYSAAKEIVAEHAENADEICLTCLADIGEKNDMLIKVGSDNETLTISIEDSNSKVYEAPYEFRFALK